MGFKRKHSRVDVGRLQRGSLSAPCKVIDVSESGCPSRKPSLREEG